MTRTLRRIWSRLFGSIFQHNRDPELVQELESHIQLMTDENIRRGLPPDEAYRRAKLTFGGIESTKESYRDQRGLPALESIVADIRYGWRQLWRSPLFAAATVLTLGLAIGANSALFAIVEAAVLRPLPYLDSERIVSITTIQRGTDIGRMDEPTAMLAMTTPLTTFEALATYNTTGANLSGDMPPERVSGATVSEDFFAAMGVEPVIGRTFAAEEMRRGATSVVVSDSLWTRAFGRRADLIGRALRLDDQVYSVVGVMPVGFSYPARSEFWLPHVPRTVPGGGLYFVDFVGRLRASVSPDEARRELVSLRRTREEDLPSIVSEAGLRVMPLHERLYGSVRAPLLIVWAVVGCVLLIATANIANLLLARASTRRRELALRVAIGASHGRLVRQLLVESMLLACVGALPGLILADAGLRAFSAFGPSEVTRIGTIAINSQVLLFTLGITLAAGLLFGVAPAFTAGRTYPQEGLNSKAGHSTGLRPGRGRPRRALVVLELALASVLVIGAALLVKSFIKYQAVERGIDGGEVLTASITLPRGRYTNTTARREFFDHVLARLRALPDVESASISPVALSGMTLTMRWPPGSTDGDGQVIGVLNNVGSDHFRTFGIPLLAGRECGAREPTSAAVINSRMAQLAFPGHSAVGERLDLGSVDEGTYTVVGVSADIRNLGTNAIPLPTVYACAGPNDAPVSGVIALRARLSTNPSTLTPMIREAVVQADPAQPLANVRTVSEMVGQAMTSRWFDAALVAVFASVALILAVFGLYAIIAYMVAERTHEIGVRMALGATRTGVLRLVLTQAGVLIIAGVALGLAAAVPLARFVASMLFDVELLDLQVFGVTALFMGFVSLVAASVPAFRAAKVDPLVSLRAE
jgi:putative ABC transport system permease protein